MITNGFNIIKKGAFILLEFIQTSFACLVGCLLFLCFVISDKSFDKLAKDLFISTIVLILILLAVDNLLSPYEVSSSTSIMRKVYSAIGYSIRPAIAYTMVLLILRNSIFQNKSLLFVISFLLVVNTVLAFVSIPTDIVFDYDSNGLFIRGILGYFPHATGLFYVLLMVFVTIFKVKVHHFSKNIVIIMIALLSIVGTVIESIFHLHCILATAMSISVIFYYLHLLVSIYTLDQLTNVYNRHIFMIDLKKIKNNSVIVSLDLNHLKQINDKHGHLKGDKALCLLVKQIDNFLPRNCDLYRVGGDEFMIICNNHKLEEIEDLMKKILVDFKKNNYSFAYGCVEYNKNIRVDLLCEQADIKMYLMKDHMKEEEKII